MKPYLSVEMEGIYGMVDASFAVSGQHNYVRGQHLMMRDTNEVDWKEFIKNTFQDAINKDIDCYYRTRKGRHTVLDHDETYIENSLPALFTGIIYKAFCSRSLYEVHVDAAEESLDPRC